jgi:5-methylcytosine-specific restriction endonuclease McrA
MDTIFARVAQLSDADLLARVHVLAQRERTATVALIAHLAELDQRRLYLAEGYSSLFTYCTDALHLSEHATYNRIEAARAVRRFPVLLQHLADGAVNLTTVRLLAPHLTPDNHIEVLAEARYLSRRATEELAARLRPQPPVPDAIRKLPTPAGSADDARSLLATFDRAAPAPQPAGTTPNAPVAPAAAAPPAPPMAARKPAVVTPLAPARYKIQFTASAALHAKLREVQALLRHQIPNGDLEQIFDRALTALHREILKRKIAATDRPRPQQAVNGDGQSREPAAAVRRAVWQRDGGRCMFVAADGRRCAEVGFLEFHHVVPYAKGGRSTVDNLELRCSAHNGYEVERALGRRTTSMVRDESPRYSGEVVSRSYRGNNNARSFRNELPWSFPRSDGTRERGVDGRSDRATRLSPT